MDEKISTGVKIHDVHHGLIQNTDAIIETHFNFLKELGAAIQIATTIKDHEVIKDLTPFYASAGELRIPRSLANVALDHLQKLEFVRLRSNSGRISRVDVKVPNLNKLYKDFGDYFNSENESKLAANLIQILEKLSAFPHKESEIVSKLTVETEDYDIIRDVGKLASLLDTYQSPSDSQSVLYSPLYWDDNPKAIFDLLKNHKSDDFFNIIASIRDYQGTPDGQVSEKILDDAITLGCLPTLAVNSTNGLKKFIFTPRTGVGKVEKELLHKARVLISCVRYGENFAGITKINNPEKLINSLLHRGFLAGHSESLTQYETARNLGLVKLVPTGVRHEVHFIDNEENKLVVQMAVEMLTVGETTRFDNTEELARNVLNSGQIIHPTQTRARLSEVPRERSKATINKINDLIRGVDI